MLVAAGAVFLRMSRTSSRRLEVLRGMSGIAASCRTVPVWSLNCATRPCGRARRDGAMLGAYAIARRTNQHPVDYSPNWRTPRQQKAASDRSDRLRRRGWSESHRRQGRSRTAHFQAEPNSLIRLRQRMTIYRQSKNRLTRCFSEESIGGARPLLAGGPPIGTEAPPNEPRPV